MPASVKKHDVVHGLIVVKRGITSYLEGKSPVGCNLDIANNSLYRKEADLVMRRVREVCFDKAIGQREEFS